VGALFNPLIDCNDGERMPWVFCRTEASSILPRGEGKGLWLCSRAVGEIESDIITEEGGADGQSDAH